MSVMAGTYSYLRDLGVVQTFKECVFLQVHALLMSLEGGPSNRIKKDNLSSELFTKDGMEKMDYLKLFFACGCMAAANVLALLVQDNEVPPIQKRELKSAKEYWKIAAKQNYVYEKQFVCDV